MTDKVALVDDVRFEIADGVATVRLTRAAKRNALTGSMYAELADGLSRLGNDAGVRVVVLTGSGGSFTAGNDLDDMSQSGELGPDSPPRRFLDALVALPQVLVVGVAGPAIGIGTTVLLHADLVYATEASTFAMPFVNLGLVPEAAATLLLPVAVGRARAAEMVLLGGRFTADQLFGWGLVNAVIPGGQDELDAHLAGVTARLIAQPASALGHARGLLRAHIADATRSRLIEDGALMNHLIQTLAGAMR
jgi:enoyl-CoA hydratase/carnithine racemase